MLTHTVRLNDRDASSPILTADEALDLALKGFRFSIYHPEAGEFRLSLPHRVAENPDRGTLTFMQEER